jgi:hypothetical protein
MRKLENIPGEMLIVDGVVAELNNIGEGFSGDYDASDPDDMPLLRLEFSRIEDGKLAEVEDSSYCTQIDARTPTDVRQRILELVLEEVGPHIRSGSSVKRLCENLSWIDASYEGGLPPHRFTP